MTAPSRIPAADSPESQPATADAPLIEHACQAVVVGRRSARALARWCKGFGLTEPGFQVLLFLRIAPICGIDQSTMAKALVLSPSQMSALVERLRFQGWIAQYDVSHDRRRRLWQLTAEGQALLETLLASASDLQFDEPRSSDSPPACEPPIVDAPRNHTGEAA